MERHARAHRVGNLQPPAEGARPGVQGPESVHSPVCLGSAPATNSPVTPGPGKGSHGPCRRATGTPRPLRHERRRRWATPAIRGQCAVAVQLAEYVLSLWSQCTFISSLV
uniref:Uncharacterized protein n=1 Tax=Cacopsylla melanoneura TaxID=428564 RepID=A0A8D8SK22_9HEMI